MTVIAAITDGTTCWMGGDSAIIAGQAVRVGGRDKVFVNGPYAIGITGSPRMGQLLHHVLRAPAPPEAGDLSAFMCTEFIGAVRDCLKDGGWAQKDDEREKGGNFLVGIHGRLFEVCSDYQITEYDGCYAATGAGEYWAMGSLHTTGYYIGVGLLSAVSPQGRLTRAMEAAAEYCTAVRAPFHIVSTGPETGAVAA